MQIATDSNTEKKPNNGYSADTIPYCNTHPSIHNNHHEFVMECQYILLLIFAYNFRLSCQLAADSQYSSAGLKNDSFFYKIHFL